MGSWPHVDAPRVQPSPVYKPQRKALTDAKLNRQYTMGMTPGPHHRGLGQPRVALPQRDAVPFRLANQDLKRLPIQPAVGRMGDRFWLHRRVDADPLQRTGFGHSGVECNPDACLQHLLHRRANPRPTADPLALKRNIPIPIIEPSRSHAFRHHLGRAFRLDRIRVR